MHVSWSCCQIFTDVKPLASPHLCVTSPILPWQISEKTLGNFMALLKINPATLKGACPLWGTGQLWPPVFCVCALELHGQLVHHQCCSQHQAHTSFLLPTSTSSAMVSYLCSKVHVVLSLSLPPPPLSFNSRKEFRTHLQRARYQITLRHHYMSQCLKRSGWRKTPSDCQHTCVSVSTRLLKFLDWGGHGAGWGVISGFMEESREVPGFIIFNFFLNEL